MEMKGTPRGKRHARRLRREMSLPEVLLWQELRKGRIGFHFRRQQPAADYALDFYCAKARLCIEVDGASHDFGERPQRDEQRDIWVSAREVRVVRIPAGDILNNLDGVIAYIREVLHERR